MVSINEEKQDDKKDNTNEIVQAKKVVDEQILIEQYKVAADLYKHEDSLTWSKLHYFLIVNSAIFVLGNMIAQEETFAFGIAGGVGIAISILFFISIANGFSYIGARKQAVMDLEKALNGLDFVTNPHIKGKPLKKVFKTGTKFAVLLFIILVGIMWGIMLLNAIC